jgi:hypothetical protein
MLTRSLAACVVLVAALLSGCNLHGQYSSSANLSGSWVLDRTLGVTAPPDFTMKVAANQDQVTIHAHWSEPPNGQYGLTLIGVTTSEMVLDIRGADTPTQVGPFVMKHRSSWENDKLVTRWSTSDYMGSSFHGTWTHAVSRDGRQLTLDIDAASGSGEQSRARLMFRRQ